MYQTIKVKLSSANVYASNAGAIPVLPEPAEGHFRLILAMAANVTGTVAYDTGALYLSNDGTVANAFYSTLIDKAASGFWAGSPSGINEYATTHIIVDGPLYVSTAEVPTQGDGDIDVYVTYIDVKK